MGEKEWENRAEYISVCSRIREILYADKIKGVESMFVFSFWISDNSIEPQLPDRIREPLVKRNRDFLFSSLINIIVEINIFLHSKEDDQEPIKSLRFVELKKMEKLLISAKKRNIIV